MLRQARLAERRGVAVTDRREQHDRVGLDSPRDERQHVRGRAVEPVGVLDDQQERSIGGDVREQVESGHRDPEVLGRGLVRQAEGGIERGALDVAELARTIAHGPEQLMQPGERQMRLRLHTGRGEHRHAPLACRPLGLGEQTRLADAGLAVKHERLAARGNVVQERRQEALFLEATQERRSFVMSRREHETSILPKPVLRIMMH